MYFKIFSRFLISFEWLLLYILCPRFLASMERQSASESRDGNFFPNVMSSGRCLNV